MDVTLYLEDIPPGSKFIRGIEGAFGGPLKFAILLLNQGDGVCKAAAALGTMSEKGNIDLGLKAIEAGFTTLDFHARKGTQVTRHAVWLSSDRHFDYYTVDLIAEARRLGIDT